MISGGDLTAEETTPLQMTRPELALFRRVRSTCWHNSSAINCAEFSPRFHPPSCVYFGIRVPGDLEIAQDERRKVMPCGRQASYGTNRRKRLPALSAPMFARIGESGGRNETKVNCHPEAGFIASKIVNRSGEGMILDIVLGIVGGVVGGWLFRPGIRVLLAAVGHRGAIKRIHRPSGYNARLPYPQRTTSWTKRN
jgi:hypothetical protein